MGRSFGSRSRRPRQRVRYKGKAGATSNAGNYRGGKQYNVSEGDTLFIEKLDVNAGDAVVFDQVLAIVDGENSKFGTPVVEGAKVDATVVKNGKGKKIRIFKYTPKKGYRKRQGHRQPYTKVEIGKISF